MLIKEKNKKTLFLFLIIICFISLQLNFASIIHAGDYVETNNYAIANYNVKALASHLTYEGYQAYCSAPEKSISRFTNNEYSNMALDFSNATIPLLRNSNYLNKRLNSAENYFGYLATQDSNSDDLLVESSSLAKLTDNNSACAFKVLNLLFIKNEHQKCEQEIASICKKQCAATGRGNACVAGCKKANKVGCDNLYQEISTGNVTTKDLIADLEANEVSSNPALYSTDMSPSLYCRNLAADQCSDSETDYAKRQEIYKTIQNLPFAFNNYYRTAYIVEAVRICPVKVNGDTCEKEPYEYDNCTWSIVPDIIRIYPFRIPDFLTNKNFCDQGLATYPGVCEVNNDYYYFDTDQNYSDPAAFNVQILQNLDQQALLRNELTTARMNRAASAQQANYNNKADIINCDNCESNLSQALVKMINGTAANNQFNEEYLGGSDADMSCASTSNEGESSTQITTSAARNNQQTSAFIETTKASAIDRFQEKCCEEWEYIIVNGAGEEVENNTDNYLVGSNTDTDNGETRIIRRCKHWYYTKAKVRYWAISPQGEQAKITEEQILGLFYKQEDYAKFVAADSRQNKKMALQNVANAKESLTLLGIGPVTNIFIVQESLYDSTSGLYQTLTQYKNINEYFVQNGGVTAGSSGGENPPIGTTSAEVCAYVNAAVRLKQCPNHSRYPCSVYNPINGTKGNDAPASAYPGGVGSGSLANCTAVAKNTISMKDYLAGVISHEDKRLLSNDVSIEALKLSIVLYKTYTVRRATKNGSELVARIDGRCFQVYRPAKLSAAAQSRFDEAYQAVSNELMFNKDTDKILAGGYTNKLQNCIINDAKSNPSASYTELMGMLHNCSSFNGASAYSQAAVGICEGK